MPIIGGGPAGMSCALWLHNYGMHPVIIEKEGALGGMARLSPYPNEWLLGLAGFLVICAGPVLALEVAKRHSETGGEKAALLATQLFLASMFAGNVVFNHTASAFVWMIFAAATASTSAQIGSPEHRRPLPNTSAPIHASGFTPRPVVGCQRTTSRAASRRMCCPLGQS